jgi:RNA polymerase sigma factor (sigma-70 family)
VVPLHSDAGMLDALVADLEAGYEAFVRAHAGVVYTTALRLSGSHAEADDLAQETFVRAYRALRRFDAERVRALMVRPWLLAITLNLWRNRLRRAARRPREVGSALPDPRDPGRGPEQAAQDSEESAVLVGLLAALPEHHRVPVVLRHVVGLSYAEIASALDCPVGTAKANVARGLVALRAGADGAPGSSSRPRAAARPRGRAAPALSRPRPVAQPKEDP